MPLTTDNSGSSNKNQEVKDTRKHDPVETAQVVTQQFNNNALREKVKELQLRHKRDLELIRNVAVEQIVDKDPGIFNAYYFDKSPFEFFNIVA